jgi:hypothetical protein
MIRRNILFFDQSHMSIGGASGAKSSEIPRSDLKTKKFHTGVQFISITNPFKTSLWDIIQCDQVVVSWNAVDTADSKFM